MVGHPLAVKRVPASDAPVTGAASRALHAAASTVDTWPMHAPHRFIRTYPVRFEDCDGAGIVFYPRYFLMANRIVEDWFADGLGLDFAALHQVHRLGIPTVDTHARFLAPGRLGDRLEVALEVRRLGSSSFTLGIDARCDGAPRFTVESVLVCVDLGDDALRSRPLPDTLRGAMENYLATATSAARGDTA